MFNIDDSIFFVVFSTLIGSKLKISEKNSNTEVDDVIDPGYSGVTKERNQYPNENTSIIETEILIPKCLLPSF